MGPFEDFDAVQAAIAIVSNNLRLEVSAFNNKLKIPTYTLPIIRTVMEACFETVPKNRPDFKWITTILNQQVTANLEATNKTPPKFNTTKTYTRRPQNLSNYSPSLRQQFPAPKTYKPPPELEDA